MPYKDKEVKRKHAHEYYLKHRERIIKDGIEYYNKFRENRQKASIRRYYKYRTTINYRRSIYGFKRKLKLMEALGSYVCVKCGFSDMRALYFDHINGGGKADRRANGNYLGWYYSKPEHIEEAKQKLQVLCANCNAIKKYDKETTHGTIKKQVPVII